MQKATDVKLHLHLAIVKNCFYAPLRARNWHPVSMRNWHPQAMCCTIHNNFKKWERGASNDWAWTLDLLFQMCHTQRKCRDLKNYKYTFGVECIAAVFPPSRSKMLQEQLTAERCRLSMLGQKLRVHLFLQTPGTDRLSTPNNCKCSTWVHAIHLPYLKEKKKCVYGCKPPALEKCRWPFNLHLVSRTGENDFST